VFDRFFLPYKNRPVNLLEMGVQHGGTLNVYSRYFHPGSNIVGVDIDPRCKQLEEGNIKIFTGNFSDAGFMRSFPYEFDIIPCFHCLKLAVHTLLKICAPLTGKTTKVV
jgi:cephalosporin hydroxylase